MGGHMPRKTGGGSMLKMDEEYHPKHPFIAVTHEKIEGNVCFPAFVYSINDISLTISQPSEDWKSLKESLFGDSELDDEECKGILFWWLGEKRLKHGLAPLFGLRIPPNLCDYTKKLEEGMEIYGDVESYRERINKIMEMPYRYNLSELKLRIRKYENDGIVIPLKPSFNRGFVEEIAEKIIGELESYEKLKKNVEQLEKWTKEKAEWVLPSLNHYIDIRSVHGRVYVRIQDPYAVVDRAESTFGNVEINGVVNTATSMHGCVKINGTACCATSLHGYVEINPQDRELPAQVRRKIKISTIHNDIRIDYEV